jgi:hypothetical protein
MTVVSIDAMSIDAVAVFRPKVLAKLLPYLDLDDDSDESKGLYAEKLEDNSFLVHTFQSYEGFRDDPKMARMWLAQFGNDLSDVHDDQRGILFFPDVLEPDGTTYEAVLEEIGDHGLWAPKQAATEAERLAYEAEIASEVEALRKDPQGYAETMKQRLADSGFAMPGAMPGAAPGAKGSLPIDFEELSRHLDTGKLQDMAAQLMGGGNISSFDFGSLVNSVQKHFADAMAKMPTEEATPEVPTKETTKAPKR